jgi:hypothetical protein
MNFSNRVISSATHGAGPTATRSVASSRETMDSISMADGGWLQALGERFGSIEQNMWEPHVLESTGAREATKT